MNIEKENNFVFLYQYFVYFKIYLTVYKEG